MKTPTTAAERERVVTDLATVLRQNQLYTWELQAEFVLTHLGHPARMNASAQ